MIEVGVTYINGQENELLKASEGAAGYDIAANDQVVLRPGESAKVATGTCIELPTDYVAELAPRSSSGDKKYRLANTIGYIDSDFRGDIKMYIENTGTTELVIYPGDYLCQLVFKKKEDVKLVKKTSLSKTKRGAGEFGSTDAKRGIV